MLYESQDSTTVLGGSDVWPVSEVKNAKISSVLGRRIYFFSVWFEDVIKNGFLF